VNHLFAELTVIRVLDFVEVVLVELSDETRKVGVFEYPGQNGFGEFVHVLDDEAVTLGTPGYDVHNLGLLEHSVLRYILEASG
jgi:hypothetical protein